MRLIIGISGASGVVYGIRLLETLRDHSDVETHLVMSATGRMNICLETDWKVNAVEDLADFVHRNNDVGATIASGSFQCDGMIVAPCSMKTLSGIVNSYADNLLCRAADVMLKEKRRLILVPRESPLHKGHCQLLLRATELGIDIAPPMPAFYTRPASVDDIVNHTVGRLLDLVGIESGLVKRWGGVRSVAE
ncbi:MAG: UbiX family flavin prenyltransferase [Proteobacteria bacterium]|nr:UbiX family flavin prenyltransferase [Pseudomonadota bacterium]